MMGKVDVNQGTTALSDLEKLYGKQLSCSVFRKIPTGGELPNTLLMSCPTAEAWLGQAWFLSWAWLKAQTGHKESI